MSELTRERLDKMAVLLPATLDGLDAGPMAVADCELLIAYARQADEALREIERLAMESGLPEKRTAAQALSRAIKHLYQISVVARAARLKEGK